MSSRFRYERRILEGAEPGTSLSIDEFVALPAYVDGKPSRDTWYDGNIVELTVANPVLADAGELTVRLLGPFWDRIFCCVFSGATALASQNLDLLSFPGVHLIELARAGDGRRTCTFSTHHANQHMAVTFKAGQVERRMLRVPMQRVGSKS